MLKRIKYLITTLSLSGLIFIPALVPVTAHAATNNVSALCGGASSQITDGSCTNTTPQINNIIKWVLDIFSVIVGIAAVIMIVVGGLKYTISGGDSTRVSGAKDTILFAIVGLVVVALAQIIVHFVLTNVGARVGG
jgi:beta-lactamase regulating signal transducer with metallopeptidase domain